MRSLSARLNPLLGSLGCDAGLWDEGGEPHQQRAFLLQGRPDHSHPDPQEPGQNHREQDLDLSDLHGSSSHINTVLLWLSSGVQAAAGAFC